MKKLLLLTKTLLAVALLCVGQNAWADKEYVQMYSETFDDGTMKGAWTVNSSSDRYWTNPENSTKYIGFYNTQNSIRENTLSFSGLSSFTTATDYIFSFYYNRGTNNQASRSSSFVKVYDTNNNLLMEINATSDDANNNTDVVSDGSGNDLLTGMACHNGWAYNNVMSSMHLITISADETSNSVKLKITDAAGATTTLAETTIYNEFARIGKVVFGVSGKNGSLGVDDVILKTYSEAETITDPSIGVTYAGANRTITVTSGTSSKGNTVTSYYTTDGSDPTSLSSVYSTPFSVNEDCTVKVISISSTDAESNIINEDVTVGTLKLNAPTFAKTAYSDGNYTVDISNNQTSLAYPPGSVTTYYRVGTVGDFSTGTSVTVAEGETLYAYVATDNYTNSDVASIATAVRPSLSEVWSIDFAGQATEDKGGVTVGTEAFTANGVSFGNITSAGLTSNDNFGVKTGTTWLLRNNSRGLYSQNGTATPVGVQGLKAGQYIKMVVNLDGLSVSDAASLVDNMSTTTEKYIIADKDGNANIHFNRYGFIKSISVCNVVVPVTVSEAGMATYVNSDYDLDFSATDIEAYKVKVSSKGVATMTKVDNVPAGTPVLLYKDGGATEDIPVMTGAAAVTENDLVAGTGAAVATIDGEYTNMILNNVDSKIGFYFANGQTVAANRAYLHIATSLAPNPAPGSARMAMFFAGSVTGVEAVEAASESTVKEGKFIENGKLIIVKNGQKYNAAGAKLY